MNDDKTKFNDKEEENDNKNEQFSFEELQKQFQKALKGLGSNSFVIPLRCDSFRVFIFYFLLFCLV